jgi:hypothetical protein
MGSDYAGRVEWLHAMYKNARDTLDEYLSQAPAPLSDAQIREAFGKLYPRDVGILELAENNRDYAIEAIGARHHWAAFLAGARAIERHVRGVSNEDA